MLFHHWYQDEECILLSRINEFVSKFENMRKIKGIDRNRLMPFIMQIATKMK